MDTIKDSIPLTESDKSINDINEKDILEQDKGLPEDDIGSYNESPDLNDSEIII